MHICSTAVECRCKIAEKLTFLALKDAIFYTYIQQLLTRCGPHGRFDIRILERVVWNLLSPKGLVGSLKMTSGGGKNLIFFPTDGSWNNYLHLTISKYV